MVEVLRSLVQRTESLLMAYIHTYEPITLDGDDKPDDDDSNLHTEHVSRTLNSGRPSNDAFNLEKSLTLLNRTANGGWRTLPKLAHPLAKRRRDCEAVLRIL